MRQWLWLALLAALLPAPRALAQPGGWQPPPLSEWTAYHRRFLAPDGRIIDTANGGISHTEGQAYSMFFAVFFNDRERFDRMWQWTRRNLSRPNDALFAWRYTPHGAFAVTDPNNATDGEIFLAWSLARAADLWNAPEYRAQAERIARAILACCVREHRGRTVMLPGINGFVSAEGTVVNLSYYAFPALRALSRVAPDPAWAALEQDGLALLAEGRFGRWRLPPDWLMLPNRAEPPRPAPGWPPRFSWDAVRVPLNLAWQGFDDPALADALRFWADPSVRMGPAAWADLRSNETSPYRGHGGLRAVEALGRMRQGSALPPPRVADMPDYYAAALLLKVRIAAVLPPEPPALVPPAQAAAARPGVVARLGGAVAEWWAGEEQAQEQAHEHAQPSSSWWRGRRPPPPPPAEEWGVRRSGGIPR